MIESSPSADLWIVRANSVCSPESDVSSRSWVIPRTPLIGVRISWLMVARNCDFATRAASARLTSDFSC